MVLILSGLVFMFFYFHLKLSARLRLCEETLRQLKTSVVGQDLHLVEQIASQSEPTASIETAEKLKIVDSRLSGSKPTSIGQRFKIPSLIKENWMGAFGAVAMVIGAVFFGLTAEIMKNPMVRVGVMMTFSFLLIALAQKLKKQRDWTLLCGWLNSIAGAVILFASFGAGSITGLQCLESPLYVLSFLCLGISMNIILAMTTPSQLVASFHVILSISAFCVAPQSPILLSIGALVSCVGLMAAFRSKWDLHLLLIVIVFAFQDTVWTISLRGQLLPWMHYWAIGCSAVVAIAAACVHYSKKYQSQKLEALPLAAHITNWGLLIWNISLHAQSLNGAPFVLGAAAVVGFLLSRVAKKKEVYWLYHTDALLSQLAAMAAIASISSFSIGFLDLGILLFLEALAFNVICRHQREEFLLRAGSVLQYISCFVCAYYCVQALGTSDQSAIYFRMAVIGALSWGYHFMGSTQNAIVDDVRFVVYGQRDLKEPISITALLGTLFFMGIYFWGFNSQAVQITTLLIAFVIALWRKLNEDLTCNITFIAFLAFIHIMNWGYLIFFPAHSSMLASRIDFFGLLFLDILLVFGDFLHLKLWKKNVHHFVIYALGLQVGLLTCIFTSEVSALMPGPAFLGCSLIALEAGRRLPGLFKSSDDVKLMMREGLTHVGLLFLLAFTTRFVVVHLLVEDLWHGISLRQVTEVMGLLAFIYWIVYYPRVETCSKRMQIFGRLLVEGFLAFTSLCILVEIAEVWRTLLWVVIAIGLLVTVSKERGGCRFPLYSWLYLMASLFNVAFGTNSLVIPVLMAIALQLCYAWLTCRSADSIVRKVESIGETGLEKVILAIYRQPSLTVLLPIFLATALLFAYNFERTILTLLWVGLTCAYLAAGLLIYSKRTIQIAMAALVFCSLRMVIFDLVQSDPATRVIVFIGVGSLMLAISVLYKKYKHRIEVYEGS